jgi:tetratricopeptide (TPR) repeat protein
MTLQSKQVPKAKKLVDECLANNANSADVWLIRANVYLQLFNQEQEKLKGNPNATSRFPDAIFIANESFYKALELDANVTPKTGLFDCKTGQILCAEPIYNIAMKESATNNLPKAIEYLNIAIRNFKLDEKSKVLAFNLGVFYGQLADMYLQANDMDNYRKTVIEGSKSKTPLPDIYLKLYDLYKEENDTVNAGKTLKNSLLYVKEDTLQREIYITYLDYYSMTNEIDKLESTCDTMLKRYGNDPDVITSIAIILNNAGQFLKAEELLNKGLQNYPNHFGLNSQMAYRYFYEGIYFQDKETELLTAKKYTEMTAMADKKKECFTLAHDWSEKAYNINNHDRENNIMLLRLKTQLAKEIDPALKEKVDSYRKN